MNDMEWMIHLLVRRCFVEAAYFGVVRALKTPSAEAHMLAGVGCCGCASPLAIGQRLLEGDSIPDEATGGSGLIISPATELPYEGFFHLLEAIRMNPDIQAPESLGEVFDAVADDLAYVSRREIHRPPDKARRYSHKLACLSAAVLLRRLTGTNRTLPGVGSTTLDCTMEIIEGELEQRGGDAIFY
jgi:hypothetical protein